MEHFGTAMKMARKLTKHFVHCHTATSEHSTQYIRNNKKVSWKGGIKLGFDLLPTTFKELFSPKSYRAWYWMPLGVLIIIGIWMFWFCGVVPYRKLNKLWRR
jgi:hypothetical protein